MLPLDFRVLLHVGFGVSATMVGAVTAGFIGFIFDLEASVGSRSECIKLVFPRFVLVECVVVSQHL